MGQPQLPNYLDGLPNELIDNIASWLQRGDLSNMQKADRRLNATTNRVFHSEWNVVVQEGSTILNHLARDLEAKFSPPNNTSPLKSLSITLDQDVPDARRETVMQGLQWDQRISRIIRVSPALKMLELTTREGQAHNGMALSLAQLTAMVQSSKMNQLKRLHIFGTSPPSNPPQHYHEHDVEWHCIVPSLRRLFITGSYWSQPKDSDRSNVEYLIANWLKRTPVVTQLHSVGNRQHSGWPAGAITNRIKPPTSLGGLINLQHLIVNAEALNPAKVVYNGEHHLPKSLQQLDIIVNTLGDFDHFKVAVMQVIANHKRNKWCNPELRTKLLLKFHDQAGWFFKNAYKSQIENAQLQNSLNTSKSTVEHFAEDICDSKDLAQVKPDLSQLGKWIRRNFPDGSPGSDDAQSGDDNDDHYNDDSSDDSDDEQDAMDVDEEEDVEIDEENEDMEIDDSEPVPRYNLRQRNRK
ncbi:hypothetical protein EJ08DRAFT_666704 [Tothia fuscella]|uniref:F-box domain-containing protein n=1 Tax=Tothia fuscella TaxID=1048955 RepID=A0A9P4NDV8_9PEZI|nr:hypothetical protein EJ08DRAFT_666704 [Tothia fuscella]